LAYVYAITKFSFAIFPDAQKLVQELDLEVAHLKSMVFATNTKRAYTTYLHSYLNFCDTHGLPALPATSINIGRYIAFLSRSHSPASVQQYLTVIRLLHLELGLPHPLQDNHHVTSLIKAIKRQKGCESRYKLPLSCDNILTMLDYLNPNKIEDAQIWSVILTCFHGLLRISNVTVPSATDWQPVKSITRSDIAFHHNGTILQIRWSKTLQLRDRVFEVALPILDSVMCPTRALLHFIGLAGPVPPHAPAWSYITPAGHLQVPTPGSVRSRLRSLFRATGLPPSDFNSHSLRRSGATYLLSQNVPLEVIKVLGDWKSDSVFKYLKPLATQKLSIVNDSFKQY